MHVRPTVLLCPLHRHPEQTDPRPGGSVHDARTGCTEPSAPVRTGCQQSSQSRDGESRSWTRSLPSEAAPSERGGRPADPGNRRATGHRTSAEHERLQQGVPGKRRGDFLWNGRG